MIQEFHTNAYCIIYTSYNCYLFFVEVRKSDVFALPILYKLLQCFPSFSKRWAFAVKNYLLIFSLLNRDIIVLNQRSWINLMIIKLYDGMLL